MTMITLASLTASLVTAAAVLTTTARPSILKAAALIQFRYVLCVHIHVTCMYMCICLMNSAQLAVCSSRYSVVAQVYGAGTTTVQCVHLLEPRSCST